MSDQVPLEDASEVAQLVEHLVEQRVADRQRVLSQEYRERLVDAAGQLLTGSDLAVGQLVRWKDGLRNKLQPGPDAPGVVLAVLQQPVYDDHHDSGSAYFREPLTLVIGVLDNDNDLAAFHVDGRRFEPFE